MVRLAGVVAVWAGLSVAVRAGIVAMVRATATPRRALGWSQPECARIRGSPADRLIRAVRADGLLNGWSSQP